jgi:hypothetical protein
MVGERWALLIIRDLLVGPKRYTDLRADGIVRISGEPAELDRFAALFRIGPPPALPLS